MKPANYFVWRRNDGYVGCTRYKPGRGWAQDAGVAFEHIAEVETWAEARPIIEANRDEMHDAAVASWRLPLESAERLLLDAFNVVMQDWEKHRGSFEGASNLLIEHLVDDHGVDRSTLPERAPLDQGGWLNLDAIHKPFHVET